MISTHEGATQVAKSQMSLMRQGICGKTFARFKMCMTYCHYHLPLLQMSWSGKLDVGGASNLSTELLSTCKLGTCAWEQYRFKELETWIFL